MATSAESEFDTMSSTTQGRDFPYDVIVAVSPIVRDI